jgi:hypothetical protein
VGAFTNPIEAGVAFGFVVAVVTISEVIHHHSVETFSK